MVRGNRLRPESTPAITHRWPRSRATASRVASFFDGMTQSEPPIAAGDAPVRFLFRNEREPARLNAGNNRRRGRSRSGERLRLWPSF
jgi:hypothetical protein